MTDEFVGLAAPAKRALAAAGVGSLAELSRRGEGEIAALHGMGPNALRILREKLAARGLGFAR
ncbi:hypothetical protein [Phenylobacterium sp.]|uniref:hypothetical protein n=1 Tax=Phenylobacterium sp. TaxID=1871053 RepID=UPI002DEB4C15|nr:hypothetical protein [Phenylobacterium sp.]